MMTEQPAHEYMDTGALTEDAVPAAPQGPIEAPGSPALADEQTTGEAPQSSEAKNPDSALPPGATVG